MPTVGRAKGSNKPPGSEDEEENALPSATSDSGGTSIPVEQEDRIVDKVVGKLKDFVQGGAAPSTSGEEGEGGGSGPPTSTTPSSPAQVEINAEDVVRRELKKIMVAEDHEHEHEHLRQELERPPQVVPWLTRKIWGGGE